MKIIVIAAFLTPLLFLASCGGGSRPAPYPEVETEGYEPFRILMLGDSYCGTISSNRQIRFDCGGLAGIQAHEQQGQRDGRSVVSRTEHGVAATIDRPPKGQKSKYYPINVLSTDQDVTEDEVKRLAFEIEKAVLKK